MQPQILVPLDGSALAETILPHATELARATGSRLTLLQAVPPPVLVEPMMGAIPPPTITYGVWETENAAARTYLAATARTLEAQHLPVETIVSNGDPATEIVDWAAQDPPNRRIAMATHGRSGLGRWVFGSVAEKVLHAAPVPLLLVRVPPDPTPPAAARHYQPQLIPLDGSALAERALDQAVPLAQATGATLWLVAVVPSSDMAELTEFSWVPPGEDAARAHMTAYLTQAAQGLQATGVPVHTEVLAGHPAQGILHQADAVTADLIVMSTHGRGGLRRLWLGSVALKVVQSAQHPVLLVRA
jgi:nucleotide-binding universal stress UspA family protein